jgi:hypothetical protein
VAGGIHDIYGSRIWNCTIVSNQTVADADGVGGIWSDVGRSSVRNSIIWGNGLDLFSNDVDYCTFGSNEFVVSGGHNLSIDPGLVNVAFGNYRLQTNSPMFSAGTTLPIERQDLYGSSRPTSAAFDIGANQFKDTDGDGMQDDWEIKHDLNPGSGGDADGNPDGDGLNNLAEYQHNTDPHKSDSDGDGISDNMDSDPATPELVLDTIFWDYYFESVFLMYVDGVPDSRWINFPTTSPRPVVLKNKHIGDHVNVQWQFVDSFGYDFPFLVFYVPHTTRGCIIPDLNADPLDQIQFGYGDWAPPGGPWGFTIAQTTPTNADLCAGFDDETPRFFPKASVQLSVPQGGTNTFTLVIEPANVVTQVFFSIDHPALASVDPTAPLVGTQLVSVAGLATGSTVTNAILNIAGYGAQNSYTTICSHVDVDILPKRTNVTVAIYAISSTNAPSTTPTNLPTQASLKFYLDAVYGKQANIYFNVLPLISTNVAYDLDGDGKLDMSSDFTAEILALRAAVSTTNAINVYYVRSNTPPTTVGIANSLLKAAFIRDSHVGSPENIAAHEIGHLLDLPHAYPDNGMTDRLMWPETQSNNPCRLVGYEWRWSNQKAGQ